MSNFDDVRIFMKTYGQEIKSNPKFPEENIVQLRYDLIKEELNELKIAFKQSDLEFDIKRKNLAFSK